MNPVNPICTTINIIKTWLIITTQWLYVLNSYLSHLYTVIHKRSHASTLSAGNNDNTLELTTNKFL